MPHRHGSYLVLGHEDKPVPGLSAPVLGLANHLFGQYIPLCASVTMYENTNMHRARPLVT